MQTRVAKLLRNTVSNVGLRIFQQLLALTLVPVMIAYVGDEGYGLLILTASILGYFGLLGAGVPAGTVKYIAEYEARDEPEMVASIINTSFAFFMCVGTIAALALSLLAATGAYGVFNISPENEESARTLLYVAAGIILLASPAAVVKSSLKGLQEFHSMNVIEGITQTLSLSGAIVAALLQLPVAAIFAVQHGILLLQYVAMSRIVKRRLPDWRPAPWKFDFGTLKLVLSLSMWLLLAQIASLLFYTTDQIILGMVLPVAALTVYKVVTQPFHVIRQFAAMFNSAVMPAVSGIEQTDGESGRNRLLFVGARYSNAIVACLAVGGALLSRPFIGLWVGPEYLEYAWIAEIACMFQLIWQSNGLFGVVYVGSGRAFRLTFTAIVTALFNLGLSIWWAHEFGVAGVVFATMVAGSLAIPVHYFWLMPALNVRRMTFLRTVVLAQAPPLLVGLCFLPVRSWLASINTWPVFIAVTLGMGLALLLATWFSVVSPSHREYVARAIRRRMPGTGQ